FLLYLYIFLTLLVLISFSLYYHVYLLYLHSFPTRRSSDLPAVLRGQHLAGVHQPARLRRRAGDDLRGRGLDADHARLHAAKIVRSEEHTSELQSRENLVCRLLLEKKK